MIKKVNQFVNNNQKDRKAKNVLGFLCQSIKAKEHQGAV